MGTFLDRKYGNKVWLSYCHQISRKNIAYLRKKKIMILYKAIKMFSKIIIYTLHKEICVPSLIGKSAPSPSLLLISHWPSDTHSLNVSDNEEVSDRLDSVGDWLRGLTDGGGVVPLSSIIRSVCVSATANTLKYTTDISELCSIAANKYSSNALLG